MFRACLGPSSGGTTIRIQQLVLIILFRWLTVFVVGLERSAILVLPNVKERMEAQLSTSLLSLHDMLRDTFTFTFTFTAVLMMIQVFWDFTPCRLANVYLSTLYNFQWYFNYKISDLLQVYGSILTTDAVKCPVGWGEGMRGEWVGFSRRCPRFDSDYHIGPGRKTVNTPTRFTHETNRLLTICLMNASPRLSL